jgi:formamidopyrimidine-DNA glycosylase
VPELPDVTVYVERLSALLVGHPLEAVRLASPFLLRSVDPPLSSVKGKPLRGVERIGKRIVLGFEDDLFLVIHLMIAGRLKWRKKGEKIPGKVGLAAFDFPPGTVLFTEASPKKRASLHVVRGRAALEPFQRGGIDVDGASAQAFSEALTRENHTLKRALTDPRILDGIGNAYSDEILHHARLSPVKLTDKLTKDELARLHASCKVVLRQWTDALRAEAGSSLPEKVTAFREGMAVHGRYRQLCPDCGGKVQRIRYAENETNYCPTCQTGGKLLADRALSRLLHGDWPKTLEELEERKEKLRQ